MEVEIVFANIQVDSFIFATVQGGTQEDASQSLPRFRAHAPCGSLVFSPFLEEDDESEEEEDDDE